MCADDATEVTAAKSIRARGDDAGLAASAATSTTMAEHCLTSEIADRATKLAQASEDDKMQPSREQPYPLLPKACECPQYDNSTTVCYVIQPHTTATTARSSPQQEQKTTLPPSYLAWSIASLLLCCLPLGLAALICSAGVLSDLDAGRYTAARRKSRAARWLNIADAALGLAAWLTLLAYLGLQALSAAATDAGYGRA